MEQVSERPEATFYQELYDLRPWYHDFARLGLQTVFDKQPTVVERLRRLIGAAAWLMGGRAVEKGERFSLRHIFSSSASSHLVNQQHKEQAIIPFTRHALEAFGEAPTCLDLFCADGYYACMFAHMYPSAIITGVDLDPKEIERAQTAARLLKVSQVRFAVADAWEFVRQAEPYDLILCTGGLYHLREPRRFLELLYPICAGFLVVQSVVTLETEDPSYFISPAPGWKHGSRFTHAGLRCWLSEAGWDVVRESREELTGNTRRCDRGSSYFLCRARGGSGGQSRPTGKES